MIKVNFRKDKYINKITVEGHAGYDVSGKDIVCSSVSSIIITTINAIIRIDEKAIDYKCNDGFVEIIVLKNTSVINHLIENMIDLLIQLEKDYKQYIKIN